MSLLLWEKTLIFLAQVSLFETRRGQNMLNWNTNTAQAPHQKIKLDSFVRKLGMHQGCSSQLGTRSGAQRSAQRSACRVRWPAGHPHLVSLRVYHMPQPSVNSTFYINSGHGYYKWNQTKRMLVSSPWANLPQEHPRHVWINVCPPMSWTSCWKRCL